jgi:hypothetical protein
VGGEAVNLHVCHRHMDVGGEDRDEQERQAPPGEELYRPDRKEQPDAAEKLANAADEDAGPVKGNPRWHDREEKLRVAQMDHSRKKEKGGEEKADDKKNHEAARKDSTAELASFVLF